MTEDFNFHGVTLRVQGHLPAIAPALHELAEDFLHFRSTDSAEEEASIQVELMGFTPRESRVPPLFCVFPGRACRVYGWGPRRACIYPDGAWVISRADRGTRTFRVYARDSARSRELSYLAILSAVGEALDRRGIHRLHALGIERKGKALIVTARPGGGKSTLALLVLREPEMNLLSDEIVLFDGDRVLPFPLRIAAHAETFTRIGRDPSELRCFHRKGYAKKYLLTIPSDRVASPLPWQEVWIGHPPRDGDAVIEPASWGDRLRLGIDLVLGIGLPQMAEYFLRADQVFALARIAASRFRVFTLILLKKSLMRRWHPSRLAQDSLSALSTP